MFEYYFVKFEFLFFGKVYFKFNYYDFFNHFKSFIRIIIKNIFYPSYIIIKFFLNHF